MPETDAEGLIRPELLRPAFAAPIEFHVATTPSPAGATAGAVAANRGLDLSAADRALLIGELAKVPAGKVCAIVRADLEGARFIVAGKDKTGRWQVAGTLGKPWDGPSQFSAELTVTF